MYRTGELDQRISIQEKQRVSDGQGGFEESWSELYEVWAHVRPKGGGEIEEYNRVNNSVSYLIVIRNGYTVNGNNSIVWEGERFNVRVPKTPKKRDLYMEIEAEKGVAV